MARRTLIIVLFLFILAVSTDYCHAQKQKTYNRYVYLVKAIGCTHEPKERALTGFRLRGLPGIITALHGVADAPSNGITVTSVDGRFQAGSVVVSMVDVKDDLALLTSPELKKLPAEGFEQAKDTNLSTGAQVWMVGYPLGTYLEPTPLSYTVGSPPHWELGRKLDGDLREALQKRNSPHLDISVLSLQGPVHPGHSGAPVLDGSDRLIAIGNGSIRVFAGYGWAIPYQGIVWKPVSGNTEFQKLKQRATSIAQFSFDDDPQTVQERIKRTLDAIKEDQVRILKMQEVATTKNRLEILRDYAPRIEDRSVRFSDRCIFLAECINAGIFKDTVALQRAAELIDDAGNSLEESRVGYPQLVAALSQQAVKHLDFVASEYGDASPQGKVLPSERRNIKDKSQALDFWWEVFQKAMADYPEICLSVLSNTQFVSRFGSRSYANFCGLCANLPEPLLRKLESYPSHSTRGLAVLQRVYGSREERKRVAPTVIKLIDANTNDEMQLAGDILDLALRRAVLDGALAQKALSLVSTDAHIVSQMMSTPEYLEDKEHRGREYRLWAAEEYLVWSVQLKAGSDVLEKPLVEVVRNYEKVLQSLETKKPEYGNGDLYARACIRVLISENKGMYGINTPLSKMVSPQVREVLEQIFAHSPDLLERVNLAHLATEWRAACKGQEYDP